MESRGTLNLPFISLCVRVVHGEFYGILTAVRVATLATRKRRTLSP